MSFISSRVARVLAFAIASPMCLALGPVSPAGAVNPPGSAIVIFLESGTSTAPGDPANAIQNGWWGKEGAGHDEPTSFSADIRDGGTAFLAAFGGDYDHTGVAFVPTSADGSAERPTVTAGELVGQAFPYWSDLGAFGSEVWSPQNPGVDGLWTQTGKDQWVADGKPTIGFDDNLVMHTPLVAGNPVAPHQYQKSVLNAWPTGTNVSVVYFQYDSVNANFEPVLHRGADGKAVTAWMPFTTVADPANPTLRTSAGYHVADAKVTPTVSLTEGAWTSGTGTLTATIANAGSTAADATGTVQFRIVSGGTATPFGSPATVSAGVASIPLGSADVGKTFEAVYTPDGPASATYDPATSGRKTVVGPQVQAQATSTTLTVSGALQAGATQTLTASVSPSGATGTVTFKDGATTLASATVQGGNASASLPLAVGSHSLTAVFTPASAATYQPSTSTAVAVTVGKVASSTSATVSPTKVKKGKKAKLVVTVRAAGVAVTGTVRVTVKPPNGKAKTISATVSGGTATVALPKAVKGKTKLTVSYLGSSTVLPSSKSLTLKVK